MDIFFKEMPKEKLMEMPILTLAHIGDCVFELMARSYVAQSGTFLANKAHQKTVALVSAKAQSKMVENLKEHLTESEMGYYQRGRNSKPKTVSKNANIFEYMCATGLESLFGALYLQGKKERIEELFAICIKAVEGEK